MGPRASLGTISLSRLRLIASIAPVVFLVVVFFMLQGPAHYDLHHFPANIALLAVLSVVVLAFTFVVFRSIERLERQVFEQNRHLSVLNKIGVAATERLALDEFLSAALEDVLEVTHADVGAIWLTHGSSRKLGVACQRGLSDPDVVRPLAERASLTAGPVVLDRSQIAELVPRPGFQSAIALPVKAEGRVYGALVVVRRAADRPRPAEIGLLSSIAGHVGMATRNARLHERVLDRAVLEERERLGRELHDSLGQMVGYVNTQTLAIKKLLASGDRAEAERHLQGMERTSQRVCVDVREAILGLRTNVSGLLPSLRTFVADYGRIAGTRLALKVGTRVEGVPLPASTELQLMRIVQEALSNVRKHANARSATVTLDAVDGELTVEISDDGAGFRRERPLNGGPGGFGLETMKERAEAIGGTFTVTSSPGNGTTVGVRVPLAHTAEVAHARAAG